MVKTDVDINDGIVVGHDGSRIASVAVRYAADLAKRLGVTLHVVRVWSITTAPKPDTMAPGYVPPYAEFEAAVLEELADHMDAIGIHDTDVDVELHAVRGQATERLLAAADGAEMLVVGARGGGGFKGLRFGSTANQIVRHATVPVLVVPNNPE
jgi:nucleotide-binding universal stress UspA family protein